MAALKLYGIIFAVCSLGLLIVGGMLLASWWRGDDGEDDPQHRDES